MSRCCAEAVGLRALINVQRAEAGLPYDRQAVAQATTIFMLPNSFEERVLKVLGGP